MQEKQAEIAAYRAYRERVEAWREQDRIARNQAKIKQLEMCEKMQVRVQTDYVSRKYFKYFKSRRRKLFLFKNA